MSEVLDALWDWLHTRQGKKIFRYTMTSVITTGVSLFVLGLVFGVLRVWTEVPSTIFANLVAAVPSYWLNRKWAWGKSGRSHLVKEVLPFWALSLSSIAFSMVGASVARELGRVWRLDHFDQTVLVLFANVVSFGIFWVLKLLVFNRTFKIPGLEDVGASASLTDEGEARALSDGTTGRATGSALLR